MEKPVLRLPTIGTYPDLYSHKMAEKKAIESFKRAEAVYRAAGKVRNTENEQARLDRFLATNGKQTIVFETGSLHREVYGEKLTLPPKASGVRLPIHTRNIVEECKVLAYQLKGIASVESLVELVKDYHEDYNFMWDEHVRNLASQKDEKKGKWNKSALFGKGTSSDSKEAYNSKLIPSLELKRQFADRFVNAANKIAYHRGNLFRLEATTGPIFDERNGPDGVLIRINYPTSVAEFKANYLKSNEM